MLCQSARLQRWMQMQKVDVADGEPLNRHWKARLANMNGQLVTMSAHDR
jgi:hypothetical protein